MDNRYAHMRWSERSRRRVARYALFDVYTSRRESHDNREADFIFLETPDWVTIVPYIADRDAFYMVRQYRHGADAITLEFPAGVVSSGEHPRAAAARELGEETGCTATYLESAGAVNPNPAFMTNRVHTFVATGLECAGEQTLDENEIIDTEIVSVDTIRQHLGAEPFTNGIMVISFTFFQRWLERSNEAT